MCAQCTSCANSSDALKFEKLTRSVSDFGCFCRALWAGCFISVLVGGPQRSCPAFNDVIFFQDRILKYLPDSRLLDSAAMAGSYHTRDGRGSHKPLSSVGAWNTSRERVIFWPCAPRHSVLAWGLCVLYISSIRLLISCLQAKCRTSKRKQGREERESLQCGPPVSAHPLGDRPASPETCLSSAGLPPAAH